MTNPDDSPLPDPLFDLSLSLRLVGSIDPSNRELPRVCLAFSALRYAEQTLVRGQGRPGVYGYLYGEVDEQRRQVIVQEVLNDPAAERHGLQRLGVVYLGDLGAWSPMRTELALCFAPQRRGIIESSPEPPCFGYGSDTQTPVQLPGYLVYEETRKLRLLQPRAKEVDDSPEKRAVRIEVPASRPTARPPAETRQQSPPPLIKAARRVRSPIRIEPARRSAQSGSGPPLGQYARPGERDIRPREQDTHPREPRRLEWLLQDPLLSRSLVGDSPGKASYLANPHQEELTLELPVELATVLAEGSDLFGLISADKQDRQDIYLVVTEFVGFNGDISMKNTDIIKTLLTGPLPTPPWGLLCLRSDCYRIFRKTNRKKRKMAKDKNKEILSLMSYIRNAVESKFYIPQYQQSYYIPPFNRYWMVVTDIGCDTYDSFHLTQKKHRGTYWWSHKDSYRCRDNSLILIGRWRGNK